MVRGGIVKFSNRDREPHPPDYCVIVYSLGHWFVSHFTDSIY